MLQFLITAEDGKDEEALARRMQARPAHLENARKLKDNNHFIVGGATLDHEGRMNGSVMIVQFETEEELNEWLYHDPYVTGKVWKKVEVKPFRVANV